MYIFVFKYNAKIYFVSLLHYKSPISLTVPSYTNVQINGLFAVALVLEATLASSTGKVETLGSTFSNETRNSEAA